MHRIQTTEDVENYLDQLIEIDPTLAPIRKVAGRLPLRLSTPDFSGLAQIVVSQHVSKQSAAAIFGRLVKLIQPLRAQQFMGIDDEVLVEVGLTRAKQQSLRELAAAIVDDRLQLSKVIDLPADEAIAQLTAFKGIGPWTAEVFLLFCGGHVDLFPEKDVALQTALGDALGIRPRPSAKECEKLAQRWAPWRGIAARLFWAYYANRPGRN